jgi:hypothetical protein
MSDRVGSLTRKTGIDSADISPSWSVCACVPRAGDAVDGDHREWTLLIAANRKITGTIGKWSLCPTPPCKTMSQ